MCHSAADPSNGLCVFPLLFWGCGGGGYACVVAGVRAFVQDHAGLNACDAFANEALPPTLRFRVFSTQK